MSLAIFSSIGIWEILILLVLVLFVFGSKRLPEMGRSLGRGMREFKDSVGDSGRELKQAISETPADFKSGLDGEEAPVEEHVSAQPQPVEGRTVEAPVATPVADAPQVPEPSPGPNQPVS